MKTKLEGHENRILKQEYDKLKAENDIMKGAMANPVCKNCGAQLFLVKYNLRSTNLGLRMLD